MEARGGNPDPGKDSESQEERGVRGSPAWRPARSPNPPNFAHLRHKLFFCEITFPRVPSAVTPGERRLTPNTGHMFLTRQDAHAAAGNSAHRRSLRWEWGGGGGQRGGGAGRLLGWASPVHSHSRVGRGGGCWTVREIPPERRKALGTRPLVAVSGWPL